MMPLEFVLEEPNKGLLLFWIQDATPQEVAKVGKRMTSP
jgi:hypothetical protein